jgi:Cu-Zn family superoxide dismutase
VASAAALRAQLFGSTAIFFRAPAAVAGRPSLDYPSALAQEGIEMTNGTRLALTTLFAATLTTGCAGMPAGGGARAEAAMESRSSSMTSGTVTLRERGDAVLARVQLRGLAPNSEHGFHVHEKGDCSAPDAMSAGPHFNPGAHPHGRPGSGAHHAGDLQNLKADGSGNVNVEVTLSGLTLAPGPNSIVGRSLVVHRDPDDFASQPAGNSGPRIACGVIAAR